MNPTIAAIAALTVLSIVPFATAQDLHFFARPFEVTENEDVLFTYLPEQGNGPALGEIASWKWDFNGDGIWDQQKTVGGQVVPAQINTTWRATFNVNKGTGDAETRNYIPVLEITTTGAQTFTQTGITEDTSGLDGIADPSFSVSVSGVLDPALTVNIFGNPRLARANDDDDLRTDEIRFFAEISYNDGFTGTITGIEWDLNSDGTSDVSGSDKDNLTLKIAPDTGADYIFPAPPGGGRDTHDVAIRVQYDLDGDSLGPRWTDWQVNREFLVIEDVPTPLSMGRAYRQGFPDRYGWKDVIQSYSSSGAGGNTYVYFDLFTDSYFEEFGILQADPNEANARRNMAETVNELLQGQSLRGFQGMIDSLRLRYPRITTLDENSGRLFPPAGAREETAGLERAALDFQQAIQFAAFAVRSFGSEILRAAPTPGDEPFPNFPAYLSFNDSTLSGAPIPIKNEYWQLATTVDGQAKSRVEKAKLLWRLSTSDSSALTEAKEECKTAATQGYLNMALMAAGQTDNQFQLNEGRAVSASMRIATDLFDKINAGVNPLGNDGSYIPNESFAAIYQDAQEAIGDARDAELRARDDQRTFDRNQADLRNELLGQRNQYLTPLKLLTGIDPAQYNYLQTVTDRKDFRNTFNNRLTNLQQNYPDANPSNLGEFGAQVAAILDAGLNLQDQVTTLNNLYENIKISKWANEEVEFVTDQATKKLKTNDIAKAFVSSFSTSIGFAGARPFTGITFNPFSTMVGLFNAEERDIQRIQQANIANIQLESEIRRSLLQVANHSIAIRRAKAQLDQATLRLESLRAQMEQYIEDLAHTRQTAETLYFQDPSFRVAASEAEQRAIDELEYAVDRLYRLAKTLEYDWTEPYQNPIDVPASSYESPALENPLFDIFTRLDSVFVIRSADEAKDYLDALKAWDSKLRRVNVSSVRGPNFTGPISAVPISLREDILGYKPDPETDYTLEDSIRDFRNYLENQRQETSFNPLNPLLDLRFPIGIEDNTFFPSSGSRWNMRIGSIAADTYAESGFHDQQVAEIDLIQSGMVTVRRYWANPPAADDLMKLTFNVDNIDRTVFSTSFPTRINGATGGRPAAEFDSPGLAGRPLGTTEWILRVDTGNPANRNIDFSKLKDIVLRFTYTYGNPQEYQGF